MKTNSRRIMQWAIYCIVGTLGMAALLALCAEDDPERPMSLTAFIMIKALALAVIYGCAKAYKRLESYGLMPDMKEPEAPNPMRLED